MAKTPKHFFRNPNLYKPRKPKRKPFTGLLSDTVGENDGANFVANAVAKEVEVKPSKICFGYTRVSTAMQDAETLAQKYMIEQRYNMQFKGQGFAWGGFFVDPAVSSSVHFMSRTAGAEVVKRMKRGDVLIIDKWDRAFRDLLDFGQTMKIWKEMGIAVISLDIGLDATTDAGNLIAGIMTLVAQQERGRIRGRIRDAVHTVIARGEHWPGARPFGFKIINTGKRVKCGNGNMKTIKHRQSWPEEREMMQQFLSWREQGYSYSEIAEFSAKEGVVRLDNGKAWRGGDVRRAVESEVALQLKARAVANGTPIYTIKNSVLGREFLMTGQDLTGVRPT